MEASSNNKFCKANHTKNMTCEDEKVIEAKSIILHLRRTTDKQNLT